jgi:hypothetical protein
MANNNIINPVVVELFIWDKASRHTNTAKYP